jgi:hypothetical protein
MTIVHWIHYFHGWRPFFGLAASVLIILAVVFAGQISSSSNDLARYSQDIAHHRFAARASSWLFALALIGFVPFFLGLATTLGQAGRGLGWIGAALLIAFAVMTAPANLAPFVVAHHLAAGVNAGNPWLARWPRVCSAFSWSWTRWRMSSLGSVPC